MRAIPLVMILLATGCAAEAEPGSTSGGTGGSGGTTGAVTIPFTSGSAQYSAAFFVEAYCSGCHQPNYVSPTGNPVATFSNDFSWVDPFHDASWAGQLDYETIVRWGPAIRCGVYPGTLPDGCSTLGDVRPGFFTKAQKFPPSGSLTTTAYGATPPPICAFSPDGHTCPQPDEQERTWMVEWIDAGYPR